MALALGFHTFPSGFLEPSSCHFRRACCGVCSLLFLSDPVSCILPLCPLCHLRERVCVHAGLPSACLLDLSPPARCPLCQPNEILTHRGPGQLSVEVFPPFGPWEEVNGKGRLWHSGERGCAPTGPALAGGPGSRRSTPRIQRCLVFIPQSYRHRSSGRPLQSVLFEFSNCK